MDVYKIPSSKKQEMEKILSMDEIFRLSITIKESSVFGENGFLYLVLEGLDERLKLAKVELSGISEYMDEKEMKRVEEYIEEERKKVYDSFGAVFK